MRLDGHIHIDQGKPNPAGLLARMKEGGVDGGILISMWPSRNQSLSFKQRLDNLMAWTDPAKNLFPFFWVDPLADDAFEEVWAACERGVMGFKVICHDHYPGHPRAIQVFRAIAREKKPILFHSGILWDGAPSAKYNRPGEFEAMIDVERARFSMAHISWPWYDELVAVYGKFQQMGPGGFSGEMFIDTTPGTPGIYRRDALTKVFTVGYNVAGSVFFGSDNGANDYNGRGVRGLIDSDEKILRGVGLSDAEIEKYFSENLRRYVGAAK